MSTIDRCRAAAAIAKLAHVYEGHMRPADALEAATTVVSGWTADRIAAYAQEAPVNTATATVHTATCTCGVHTPIMPGTARYTCRCGTTYLVPDQDSFAYGETKTLVAA